MSNSPFDPNSQNNNRASFNHNANRIDFDNSNPFEPSFADYNSQKGNKYPMDFEGPFLVYILDSNPDKNIGNLHIISIGSRIFEAGFRVSSLQREGSKKYSLAFNSASEANSFVAKGITELDPLWLAYIPDVSLFNVGVLLDIPPEIPIEVLTKGIVCPQGESFQKLVRLNRESSSDEGRFNVNLSKIKIFSTGPLPKFVSIFGVIRKVMQHVPDVLRCYNCQQFGHGTKFCNNLDVCVQCSKHHTGDCFSDPLCVNCKKAHPASSKSCIFFEFHKEVNVISTFLNISKAHAVFIAKQRYLQNLAPITEFGPISIETPNPYIDSITLTLLEHQIVNSNSTSSSPPIIDSQFPSVTVVNTNPQILNPKNNSFNQDSDKTLSVSPGFLPNTVGGSDDLFNLQVASLNPPDHTEEISFADTLVTNTQKTPSPSHRKDTSYLPNSVKNQSPDKLNTGRPAFSRDSYLKKNSKRKNNHNSPTGNRSNSRRKF